MCAPRTFDAARLAVDCALRQLNSVIMVHVGCLDRSAQVVIALGRGGIETDLDELAFRQKAAELGRQVAGDDTNTPMGSARG